MEISFSVLSIEDNPSDVDVIRLQISFNKHFHYLGNAASFAEGLRLIATYRPDLLILDIDLPDGNSMDRIGEIRRLCDWPMHIVFHTVYDNYVIQAIRQQAFDYLIKPFLPEEMAEMLERVEENFCKQLFGGKSDVDCSAMTPPLKQQNTDAQLNGVASTTVMVSNGDGFCRIDLSKVVYFEHIPKSKYWRLFLPDGACYTLRKESSYADILPMNPQFVQVSQAAIINLNYLSVFKRDTVTLLPPYEDVQLTVSRNYLPGLQARLLFI